MVGSATGRLLQHILGVSVGDYLDVNNEDYSFVSSNKTLEVIGSMDDMYICIYVCM